MCETAQRFRCHDCQHVLHQAFISCSSKGQLYLVLSAIVSAGTSNVTECCLHKGTRHTYETSQQPPCIIISCSETVTHPKIALLMWISFYGFFCREAARLRLNDFHAADGGQDASQNNLQLMHVMQAATSKGRDDEKGRKALISIS